MKHTTYIHEHSNWTEWQWSDKKLLPLVSRVRILQGRLLGKLLTLGFELNVEAQLDAVTLEIVKTSETAVCEPAIELFVVELFTNVTMLVVFTTISVKNEIFEVSLFNTVVILL